MTNSTWSQTLLQLCQTLHNVQYLEHGTHSNIESSHRYFHSSNRYVVMLKDFCDTCLFTFTHLADAFVWSDLQHSDFFYFFLFYHFICAFGIWTHDLGVASVVLFELQDSTVDGFMVDLYCQSSIKTLFMRIIHWISTFWTYLYFMNYSWS